MDGSEDTAARGRSWVTMVLLMTWVAGSVDAIGYLGLKHVFTANMTGNTVLLGLALGQGQGLAAVRSLYALCGYIAGAAIAALITGHHASSLDPRRPVTHAVLVEAGVLALFTLTWHVPAFARSGFDVPVLIVLSAIAMGVQSVAVRKLNLPGIVTTYITGTITSLVTGLVTRARLWRPRVEPKLGAEIATDWERRVSLQAGVFFVYGLAAATSAFLQVRLPALVAISPLLAIGFALIRMPLAADRSPGASR